MELVKKIREFFSIEYIVPEGKRLGELPKSRAIYGDYIRMAWPSAMQGFLMDLMMAIDLAMVGTLGAKALASVGIMGQPKMVLFILARALAVPITAMVARRKGENRIEDMNSILKQGLLLTVIAYIPILMMAMIYLKEILILAGSKTSILAGAMGYGSYIIIGIGFAVISQIIGAALIGIGETKVVFKANVIGNLVNVFMNMCLIFGLFIFPKMGVAGAGLATMLGNLVTMILILREACKSSQGLNILKIGSWKFHSENLFLFAKLGGSSFGEQIFERTGMFIYTRMVAKIGVVALATHYVCMNLCDIFYSFDLGLGYAGASFTGQYLGKKRKDLAEAYGKVGMRVGFILAAIACLLYLIFRYQLADIYTDDERVIGMVAKLSIIVAIAAFPQTFQLVFSGVLKGAGDNFYVMVYSLGIIAIFRPILTYVLCFTFNMGVLGAWIALLCDQSLRMTFSGIRFFSGKWKNIKI